MAHHSGSRSSASHPEPERRNSVTPMCLGEGFTRFLSSRSMVRIHQGAYMSHQRFSVICREPFFLMHQRLCADSTQAQQGRWCSRELCAQIAGTGTCNETSQQEQISELKLQTEMLEADTPIDVQPSKTFMLLISEHCSVPWMRPAGELAKNFNYTYVS